MNLNAQKKAAAETAVKLVESGMVVGLGTGSTAAYAIAALIRRVKQEGLEITAIPTSVRSGRQAKGGGIPLVTFASVPSVDITIDGADQILPGSLDLVKGLGGALLREKIVAAASGRLVIIADGSKLVRRLGGAIPVEVVEFGWETTAARVERLGGQPTLRYERATGKPFRTDSHNLILDCRFPEQDDPAGLERALSQTVGVVECGLFIGMAATAFVADATGVTRYDRVTG